MVSLRQARIGARPRPRVRQSLPARASAVVLPPASLASVVRAQQAGRRAEGRHRLALHVSTTLRWRTAAARKNEDRKESGDSASVCAGMRAEGRGWHGWSSMPIPLPRGSSQGPGLYSSSVARCAAGLVHLGARAYSTRARSSSEKLFMHTASPVTGRNWEKETPQLRIRIFFVQIHEGSKVVWWQLLVL